MLFASAGAVFMCRCCTPPEASCKISVPAFKRHPAFFAESFVVTGKPSALLLLSLSGGGDGWAHALRCCFVALWTCSRLKKTRARKDRRKASRSGHDTASSVADMGSKRCNLGSFGLRVFFAVLVAEMPGSSDLSNPGAHLQSESVDLSRAAALRFPGTCTCVSLIEVPSGRRRLAQGPARGAFNKSLTLALATSMGFWPSLVWRVTSAFWDCVGFQGLCSEWSLMTSCVSAS